jgi:DNA mismatch repair protein MSH4
MSLSTKLPKAHYSRLPDSLSSQTPASSSMRPVTLRSTNNSTSNQHLDTPSISRMTNRRPSVSRPGSRATIRNYSRTAASTIGGGESQHIVCAISEARGVSPTVGMAFVNIDTGEAVLSQICDNQFYARTIHKLHIFEPTEILISSTNSKSNLYSLIDERVIGSRIVLLDRSYWSESAGLDYISQLAFKEDVEAIRVAVGGNYFATCCLAAVGQNLLTILRDRKIF